MVIPLLQIWSRMSLATDNLDTQAIVYASTDGV